MCTRSRKKKGIVAASMLIIGAAAVAKTWTWAIPDPPMIIGELRAGQVGVHELGQKKKPAVKDTVRASFSGLNNPTGLYLKVSALSSVRYEEISFSKCGGGGGGVIQ